MTAGRAFRFLIRYERLQASIAEAERVLSLFDRNGHGPPAADEWNEAHALLVSYLAPDREKLTERLFHHYRLFERMTVMLSRAIRRIPEKPHRDYLIWHYLYHFTHESIAEVLHYSERQVYRQASAARCALGKTLRLPPQAVPLKGRRFRKATALPLAKES